ncbi:30S ribosomal protein S16 [Patescibacteria group bacterium]|nr:MAG: 30S ribosomal protein S16 [Patescibacteria group bacterium]
MVTIRLSRVGRKNAPSYRLVVQDKLKDPWGKSIEILGHFNPHANPREIVLKADRVKHWLEKGAQPSDTVWNLFVDQKLVEGKKHSVTHISKTRAKAMAEEKAKVAS